MTTQQTQLLTLYRDWLVNEAVPAGGMGIDEVSRVDRRHIADSLLFLRPLASEPGEMWDLGSGVGLPGIPLAIVLPDTRVQLVERSGRRARLARRAIRVLDLANTQVVEGEIEDMGGRVEVVVSRASLPPERLSVFVKDHLTRSGVAVVGGSWTSEPAASGWETKDVGSEVLDQPVWILIMRPQ